MAGGLSVMSKRALLACTAVAVSVLISGCSGGQEKKPNLIKTVPAKIAEAVKTRRAGRPKQVTVTPGMLKATKEPALQVNLLKFGGTDFMRRLQSRRDASGDIIDIWFSKDTSQLIMRNGMLISSKGIGGDVLSTDAGYMLRALKTASSGSGIRNVVLSQAGNTSLKISFRCQVTNLGSSPTKVVINTYNTVHLREKCVAQNQNNLNITNDYWVEPGTGLVRKSRQWVGPLVEYFEMIVLKY